MIGRCIILLLISYESIAQTHLGPRYQAMGYTGTALQGIYSLTANPAGLTGIERPTANIAYQHHFLTTDISMQTALLGVPTQLGTFGLAVNRYGLQGAYEESKAGFAYAKEFGANVAVAMLIDYHQLRIPNYGSNRAFSMDAGLQYQLNNRIRIGMYYANVGNATYDQDVYGVIPSFIRIGTGYLLDNVMIASDVVYDRYSGGFDGHLGIEYDLLKALSLRGGLSFNPMQQYTGFGLVWESLVFDVAATFHPRLGTSPQIGICYAF